MENKYYIVGFEYNNAWKPANIYNYEADGVVHFTEDIWIAPTFEFQEVQVLREYLQSGWPDYTWYLMLENKNPNQ